MFSYNPCCLIIPSRLIEYSRTPSCYLMLHVTFRPTLRVALISLASKIQQFTIFVIITLVPFHKLMTSDSYNHFFLNCLVILISCGKLSQTVSFNLLPRNHREAKTSKQKSAIGRHLWEIKITTSSITCDNFRIDYFELLNVVLRTIFD